MWTKRERTLLWTLAIVLVLFPVFVLEAKEVSATEPVLTWNLFLTLFLVPLSVSILGLFFSRKLDKQNDGWQKYHDEVKEHQQEWRLAFQNNLCNVKEIVGDIRQKLQEKADIADYKKVEVELVSQDRKLFTLELAVKVVEKRIDDHLEGGYGIK